MKALHKVIKRVLRYEIGVFLKNSDFSYLYGSISYLFGYEKNRCFFLMHRVGRRRGRLTSSARQSLQSLVMQSSAPAPGAQSTCDSALGYRGQNLTVIEHALGAQSLVLLALLAAVLPGARPPLRPSGLAHARDGIGAQRGAHRLSSLSLTPLSLTSLASFR